MHDVVDHERPATGAVDRDAGRLGPNRSRRSAARLAPYGLMALTAVLALAGLGRRGMWLDEAMSLGATRNIWFTVTRTGWSMALYYGALVPWAAVSTTAVWLRALSVVFAMAAVPVVFATARMVGGSRIAWTSTAVLTVSWLFVRYAQEARAYALFLLLCALSWSGIARAVAAGGGRASRWWWRLFCTTAILGLLTHGLSALHLTVQVAVLAVAPDARSWLRRAMPTLVVASVVLLVFAATGASAIGNFLPPLNAHQGRDLLAALTGPSAAAQAVLLAAVAGGAVVAVRRRGDAPPTGVSAWLKVLVVAWALGPVVLLVAVSVVRNYLVPRYAIGSLPAMAILIGFALDRPAPWKRAALSAVVAATLVAGQVSLHRERGDDWEAAAAHLTRAGRAGDGLVVTTPALRAPLDFVLERSRPTPIAPMSPRNRLGRTRDWYRFTPAADVPSSISRSGRPRVWLLDQAAHDLVPNLGHVLAAPEVRAAYRVAERRRFGGAIDVVLLVRR